MRLLTHAAAPVTDGTNATTSAIDTRTANLIVLGISYNAGIGTPTVTDSLSNSWTALTLHQESGVYSHRLLYASQPIVGVAHTFSLSGAASYGSIFAASFVGAKGSSPFDVQNGGNVGSGTTIQAGSVTPTTGGQLLVTGLFLTIEGLPTVDSGFTIADSIQFWSGNNYGGSLAYLFQTTPAAVNPTWTLPGSSGSAASIATFKPGTAFGTINNPL